MAKNKSFPRTQILPSILENRLIPGGKESDKGRQTLTPLDPFGGDSDEEEPGMITQFLKRCTITVIGNVIKMPFVG